MANAMASVDFRSAPDAVVASIVSAARRLSASGARGGSLDAPKVRHLVEAAKRGDPEAFGEIFEAFHRDVSRLCERLLGSVAEADDATHETFLKVRGSLDQYDPKRRFRPWLLAIASNHALDRLRRRTTERRLFEADESAGENVASPGPSPLQGELDASRRRQMLAAIDALPDYQRAPLVLRYYADLEYESIAKLLGVSKNQVATLLFRGRRRLRDALSPDGEAKR